MAGKSKIEWTDVTWNPLRGCTRVSAGCDHCYAEGMAARFSKPGQWGEGVAKMVHHMPHWTGQIKLVEDKLDEPLRWRKPRRVFVNSMSDLFHEAVPDDFIDRVFAVMALTPQHTFQILTKRPERMREYLDALNHYRIYQGSYGLGDPLPLEIETPLPNVWLGVSVENQATADARIPHLLATPAAVRFVSYEPALGGVDFERVKSPLTNVPTIDVLRSGTWDAGGGFTNIKDVGRLDWIICGGESGPGARPMHPDWARAARDQCQAAGVAFFFKQFGEWEFIVSAEDMQDHMRYDGDDDDLRDNAKRCEVIGASGIRINPEGRFEWWEKAKFAEGDVTMRRVGKKAAGRLLDGREWNEYPGVG